jgi:predicted lipoprotein with Yx(FWY)xxD motif
VDNGMMETRTSQPDHRRSLVLRMGGAVLLAVAGAIHLDLYLTGYRSIPTIGWLFLLQTITAFGLAILIAVSRNWLLSAGGAIFALSTLGGYLLSVWIGLFGFTEVRTTAGIIAGVIEVAAFAALAGASLAAVQRTWPTSPAGRMAAGLSARVRAAGPLPARATLGISAAALVLLGVAAATSGAHGAAAGGGSLRTAAVGGVRVLTNSHGFTLYWFAPDTPAESKCSASCAAYWPPVPGRASAAVGIPGIPGRFSTITRSDGSVQATYNGHPLYTYIGDSAPGQAHGNNINLNGGLWHEVVVSG